jgi:hypothetical protein
LHPGWGQGPAQLRPLGVDRVGRGNILLCAPWLPSSFACSLLYLVAFRSGCTHSQNQPAPTPGHQYKFTTPTPHTDTSHSQIALAIPHTPPARVWSCGPRVTPGTFNRGVVSLTLILCDHPALPPPSPPTPTPPAAPGSRPKYIRSAPRSLPHQQQSLYSPPNPHGVHTHSQPPPTTQKLITPGPPQHTTHPKAALLSYPPAGTPNRRGVPVPRGTVPWAPSCCSWGHGPDTPLAPGRGGAPVGLHDGVTAPRPGPWCTLFFCSKLFRLLAPPWRSWGSTPRSP